MTQFIPVGLETINTLLLHEILENHIYNSWTNSDPVPRNQIRFGYKVDQNVVLNAKNSLKCYDAGQTETPMYTNDSAIIVKNEVAILLQTRQINTISTDVPNELNMMRNKIRNIININKIGLFSSGIVTMSFGSNDPAKLNDVDKNIHELVLHVTLTQILDKVA